MNNKSFFIVFLEDGRAPSFKHQTLQDAEKEAKRLAELTNKKAYVLCTLKSIELNKFSIDDLRPEEDLPF